MTHAEGVLALIIVGIAIIINGVQYAFGKTTGPQAARVVACIVVLTIVASMVFGD